VQPSQIQPATQQRLSAQLPIEHSQNTICLAEEVNVFRHQWKSSGAGDGSGAARTRTHASDGGARRQRQGGGAGGGGEAFSIYLINNEQLQFLVRLANKTHNQQRFQPRKFGND
jgi:hypothetical protein